MLVTALRLARTISALAQWIFGKLIAGCGLTLTIVRCADGSSSWR
jgi:hypothetical protein